MGVRLYPNTTDTASLEQIAGVPTGTAARLEALEAAHPERNHCNNYAAGEAFYNALYDGDRDVCHYHSFLLSGWGRVISDLCADCAGSETHPDRVLQILRTQGVALDFEVALCEGVHWC
jgi:hypothetical protein